MLKFLFYEAPRPWGKLPTAPPLGGPAMENWLPEVLMNEKFELLNKCFIWSVVHCFQGIFSQLLITQANSIINPQDWKSSSTFLLFWFLSRLVNKDGLRSDQRHEPRDFVLWKHDQIKVIDLFWSLDRKLWVET